MTTTANEAAEWTLVTDSEPRPSDDREAIGRELDEIRHNLGISERALAERLQVDRATLKRVFAGDPTVRQSKWKSIETRIRALDAEMSSERAGSDAPADEVKVVELRLPSVGGEVVVRGSIDDLDALTEAVLNLRRRYLEDQGGSTAD